MSSSHDSHNIKRRDFIISSAAVSVSTGLSIYSNSTSAESVARSTLDISGIDELTPDNMPKGFSLNEMRRRWKKMQRVDESI